MKTRLTSLSVSVLVLAGAVAAASGPAAFGQGAERDTARSAVPPGDGAGGEETPEMIRRVIERQLERSKRQQAALEEAKAMAERGEPMAALRQKLREALGPAGGGGFGAGLRERGGRDRPGMDRPGPDGPNGGEGDGERPFERQRRQRDAGWPGLFGPGGPGGPEAGPGGPERGPREVSNGPMDGRQLDEVLEFVEKNRPEMARRLRELHKKDPEALRVFLRDKGQQIMRMMRDEAEQPGLFAARKAMGEAERESFEAARAARAMGDGEAKNKAVERLRAALRAQFDARASMAQIEIGGAKSRAEKLAKKLGEAVSKRDVILEERLKQALAGEELMDPPTPPPGEGPRGREGPGGSGGPGGPGHRGGPDGPPRGGEGRDLFEDDGERKPR